MAKDDKGHGSNGKGAHYGKLTDAALSRRFNKLSNMEKPTDAHADALELVVDERERRRGKPAPAPGRAALPRGVEAHNEMLAGRHGATNAAKAKKAEAIVNGAKKGDGKSINPRGDTFKPKGR